MINRSFMSALFAALLLTATTTYGAPTINVGTHNVLPDQIVSIPIMVTGGDDVSGLQLNAQIADGGPAAGGSIEGPIFTGVTYVGSIWEDAPGGFSTSGGVVGAAPQVFQGGVDAGDETIEIVSAEGLLATLLVDTTGFTVGQSFDLLLGGDGHLPSDSSFSALVGGNITTLDPTINNGTINIIPEPASLALLGAGMALLIRRRRA